MARKERRGLLSLLGEDLKVSRAVEVQPWRPSRAGTLR